MFEERSRDPQSDQGGEIWEHTLSGQNDWERLEVTGYTAFEHFAQQGVWPLQRAHEHEAFQVFQSHLADRLEELAGGHQQYLSLAQGLDFRCPLMGMQQDGGLVLGTQTVLQNHDNYSMVFDGSFLYPLPRGPISNLAILRLREARGGSAWALSGYRMIPLYSPAAFACELELLGRRSYGSPSELQGASFLGREAMLAAKERGVDDDILSSLAVGVEDEQLKLVCECGEHGTLQVRIRLHPWNGRLLYHISNPE